MLETKDLYKRYKPKKGVPVTAVDHVSIRFPEKGMVFLLGKSGSGKSTMLNLLGGLDKYDEGEIIIKGTSSKDFNQQKFDSYRNTYVGFIFQEYNVLEEFTVGANIGLAIELQGRKASDEEINKILHDVDLDGYGSRKPNELSGGQKQRVAIARALVKNPEIIMADEPTGALDSNTGRQILDTLKKLSAEKLVIIVSHDREYAEQYADRIIEMADGKVVRDVEASSDDIGEEQSLVFRTNTVEIPYGYHLTEEDRIQINEYIDKVKHGLTVTVPGAGQRFHDTDQSAIAVSEENNFKLIKSKLPMKSAFKIGSSSLKHKRFRLVMTIFLSVIAFTLFSLVDTFSSYDHIRSCVDSLMDSNINYISLSRTEKHGQGMSSWWSHSQSSLSVDDLNNIESETGIPVVGIFKPKMTDLSFMKNFDGSYQTEENSYMTDLRSFCGFAEITEESLNDIGYSIYAGKLPDGSKNEIAISKMACDTFIHGGYIKATPEKEEDSSVPGKAKELTEEDKEQKQQKPEKFSEPHYMIGKTLLINNELYTITGIIDTKYDGNRFEKLNMNQDRMSGADNLINYLLESEYNCAVYNSLTGTAMVGPGKVSKMVEEQPAIYEPQTGGVWLQSNYDQSRNTNIYYSSNTVSRLSDIPSEDIIWTDGPKSTLADNEVIVTLSCLYAEGNRNSSQIVPEDEEITENTLSDAINVINESGELIASTYNYDQGKGDDIKDVKILGCFKSDSIYAKSSSTVYSDSILNKLVKITNGVYDTAVGAMPSSRSDIEKVVRYCYKDGDDVTYRYELNNAVTYELDTFNSIIKVLSKVFFYIGLFFAVFASILMANFISVSISYKKQEIGILRAIGSRSNDVFRIFFSESFLIAMIEFVLTSLLCGIGVTIFNSVVRTKFGVLITLLHFGIRQVLLILLISIGVAAIASFLPVRKIASKKPIDAIRNK